MARDRGAQDGQRIRGSVAAIGPVGVPLDTPTEKGNAKTVRIAGDDILDERPVFRIELKFEDAGLGQQPLKDDLDGDGREQGKQNWDVY